MFAGVARQESMSTFLIAFALGAGLATAVLLLVRRGKTGGQSERKPDDHLEILAQISGAHSYDDAVKAAMAYVNSLKGVTQSLYLSKRGDHFRVENTLGYDGAADPSTSCSYHRRWEASFTARHGLLALTDIPDITSESDSITHQFPGLSRCLPVFWGHHVYGLILLKLNGRDVDSALHTQLRTVSQMLSAVAHIDSVRGTELARTLNGNGESSTQEQGDHRPARQVLRLVRHRNSETVVRRLIGTAQSEIGLERFVGIYEPKNRTESLQVVAGGIHHTLHVPRRESFELLVSRLRGSKVVDIHAPAAGGSIDELSCELGRGGLRHAVAFPLSPNRRGLIAWADSKPPSEIAQKLIFFNDAAAELVENAESFERVEELSHTDPLTGLYNHRYLQDRLAQEVNRARRYRRALGLVMIDVDLLKTVNDKFGHQAGDAVLCQMGKLFRQSVRDNDVVARYGGDEFCVVMPEADLSTCELFMARIRTGLATSEFELPGEAQRVKCTISLGAAVFPEHGDNPEKLIFAADMGLLKAKEQGRNTSQLFQS